MPSIKIRKLESERGDLHAVIPPLANRYGQIGAARQLGVSTSTISRWLKINGYEPKTQWVRKEKAG